ncbi:DUF4349 domain-containing protein [Marasmitruncus massiliensis]|uniref:DUF4349 domain-containing protein n=1 Tax=Marasmitruncus massiliensis TaxID=1944642 RepID=UPI000C7E72B3|nr:DUF4349 domain-containing protein [Marasmitruncus massiliensis]
MHHKSNIQTILAIAAAFSIVLTGCGAAKSSTSAARSIAAPAEIAASPQMEYGALADAAMSAESAAQDNGAMKLQSTAESAPAAPSERKIVKRSELSLETKEFDTALSKLVQLVESAGGYVEGQSTNGRSLNNRDTYYSRSAEIRARIPADKLDEVTSSVGELCNIVSRNDSTDDITDTYYDSQAHLDVLKVQEERLLDILGKAEKLEDVVTLEKALSDVRYQIESLTASLKRMDSQVTYSYLNLYLQEVGEYNQPVNTPKSFADRLSATFSRSISHVTNSVQGVVLFVVEVIPALLFWGIVIAVILLILYKGMAGISARRNRKLGNAMDNPAAEPLSKDEETK